MTEYSRLIQWDNTGEAQFAHKEVLTLYLDNYVFSSLQDRSIKPITEKYKHCTKISIPGMRGTLSDTFLLP